MDKKEKSDELLIANKELAFQNGEKEKRAAELAIANKELAFQDDEKEKRAAELVIANKELVFQNGEKEKRATELATANIELAFQNQEKEKRAEELKSANKELAFQNEEKEKCAAELFISNRDLLKAKEKILNGNRLYSFISHTNQTIVHVKDEQTLFNDACSIAINKGKFKMAWIGIADTATRRIKLVASCGANESDISLLSDYAYSSEGPIEKTLQGLNYFLIPDLEKETEGPWNIHTEERGFKSSICLPIKKSGKTIGVFSLYSSETDFFDTEEIKMLIEAANDISFAANLFEENRQKEIIHQKLEYSEARLQEAQSLGRIANWEVDLNTNTHFWSDEFYNIFGLNRETKPSAEAFLSVLHPEDAGKASDSVAHAFKTSEAGSFTSRFIKKMRA